MAEFNITRKKEYPEFFSINYFVNLTKVFVSQLLIA